MPIDYSNYSKDWKLRSRFIRFYRADNRCELCGAINHSYVNKLTRELCTQDEENAIRIVLTVAHLDHDINNNSFFNLKAMCQKCHLSYDAKHHAETRRQKRISKNQLLINF
jgi:hypothetical protein